MSESSRAPLSSLAGAWNYLDAHTAPLLPDLIPLAEAAGRILTEPLVAPLAHPPFRRAMMDGYALRAADLLGATATTPVILDVAASLLAGEAQHPDLASSTGTLPRQAIRIATGANVPPSADAVLPSELVRVLATNAAGQPTQIAALAAVAPGKHVAEVGEDIALGRQLCAAGDRLRATDLGVLAALGIHQVQVRRAPRVAVVITGSELLPRGTPLPWGDRVVDANGPLLEALIRRDGGIPITGPILADDPQQLLAALQIEADLLVLVGGSSVGPADFCRELLAAHAELPIRGIDIRPARPTCLGRQGNRLLALLPGPPLACLVAYELLVGRAIRNLAGRGLAWPYASQTLPLAHALMSQPGRVDYTRVQVRDGQAWPVAGPPNGLQGQLLADGFLLVPAEVDVLPAGTACEVWLY